MISISCLAALLLPGNHHPMAGVVNFSSDKLLCSHHQQQPLLTVAAAKNPIYCSDFDRKCTDNNQPEIQFIALAGAGAGGEEGAALHDCCCHSAHNYTTSTLVRLILVTMKVDIID